MSDEPGGILGLTTKQWYIRILERSVTARRDPVSGLPDFLKTSQELLFSEADWLNIWSMKLTRGLSPAQKSWLFEHQNNLHVTNERLHKLGKKNSPNCEFCEEKDDRVHLLFCSFNKAITSTFRNISEEVCMEKLSPTQLALADFQPPRLSKLAFLFLFCEISVQLQKSRERKKELSNQSLVSSSWPRLVSSCKYIDTNQHMTWCPVGCSGSFISLN